MRSVFSIGLVVYIFYLGVVTLAPFQFMFVRRPNWWARSFIFSPFDLFANALLFLPLGIILHTLFQNGTFPARLRNTIFISAAISFSIETTQLFIPERYSSWVDLFSNTVGGGAGFFLMEKAVQAGITDPLIRYRRPIASIGLIVLAGALLFLAAFSWEGLDRWDPRARLWIGDGPEGEESWNGSIFSLAFYDRALSPETMERHYQSGPRLPPEGPAAYYPFDEGGGSITHDRSGSVPALDLAPREKRAAQWLRPAGIALHHTVWASRESAATLLRRIGSTHRFTVEAWIEPLQESPTYESRRLVSFTKAPNVDFFLLRQNGDELVFEVRNRGGRGHPDWASLETPALRFPPGPAHLAAVYDLGRMYLYLNGLKVGEAILTDGFFLLADFLSLRTTDAKERGLLGLLLFGPVGLLVAFAVGAGGFGRIVGAAFLSLIFFSLIQFLQIQHEAIFFNGAMVLAPIVACLAGAFLGSFWEYQLKEWERDAA